MDKRIISRTIWLGLALQLPLTGAALAQGFRINGSGGLDGPTVFNRSYSYSFNGLPGFTNPPTPNPFGTNWLTTLQDSDGPLVVPPMPDRALTATIQKAGDPVMNFHFPDLPFPLTNLPLGQTFVTGQAQEVNTAGGGFDIGRTSVVVRGTATEPVAQVQLGGRSPSGRAITALSDFRWSLHNPVGNAPITGITITPSYAGGVQGNPVNGLPGGQVLRGGQNTGGGFGTNQPRGRPVDYELSASGSPLSDTHLAFFGLIDGSPGELDLEQATLLFEPDTQSFDVPMFDDVAGNPLYVGVDLTQWLSAPLDLMPTNGETFAISGGTDSATLPGFIFSTTPITDTGSGFADVTPFTGEVMDRAFIDGDVPMPEPGTLALLATGLAGIAAQRWVRRSRKPTDVLNVRGSS